MNPLRRTCDEMAGALRSVRYDLGQRPEPVEPGPEAEVTSTGMDTFGGAPAEGVSTGSQVEPGARAPRRLAVAGALGMLAVAGAAGSYLAVVNGIGPLLNERAAAGSEPYPLAAAAAPGPADTASDGMGWSSGDGADGPRAAAPAPTKVIVVPPPAPRPPAVTGLSAPVVAPTTTATTPAGHPGDTRCDCLTPPVPTPTAPGSGSASSPASGPSGEPSSSPSAEPSWADEDPADSSRPWHDDRHFQHFRHGRQR